MKTLEERAKSTADWLYRRLPIPKVYNLPKMFADMLTEQRESDIKVLSKVYADLLSAEGYDIGTINSELARLQKEIKEE